MSPKQIDLSEAILSVFTEHDLFQDESGKRFQAVTQTDLMSRLRDKGWRLPPAGFFLSDVRIAGFTVRQGYQFPEPVFRAYSDGSAGRKLADYQTIIFI